MRDVGEDLGFFRLVLLKVPERRSTFPCAPAGDSMVRIWLRSFSKSWMD